MKLTRLAAILVLGVIIFSCNKGKRQPILTTASMYDIFPKTASGGGVLYSEGDGKVTEKGLCWNEAGNPTINNHKVVAGQAEGSFSAEITGLEPNTTYYVCAYATNKYGTSYGKETSFRTAYPTPLPTLITSGPYALSTSSFMCSGNISALNSNGLISVGLCWSTNPTPTIDDSHTTEAFSSLSFTNSITGLNANTDYYVRAYATNNSGTAYGNELKITSYAGTVTDIDGHTYFTKTIGSQVWMAENLRVSRYRDGSAITLAATDQAWISLSTGGYCSYNNDPANEAVYGKLYNWYAASDVRKIAPLGWHVPTDVEWQQLQNYLGSSDPATIMKSQTLWYAGGNNQSGFNALPGGGRGNTGAFDGLSYSAGFWCSTPDNTTQSWLYNVLFDSPKLNRLATDNVSGFSIRCVKD